MIVRWAMMQEVDAVFQQVGERMQGASARSGLRASVPGLWRMCRAGEAFLMIALDGETVIMASVWSFQDSPKGIYFKCHALCGSRMKEWAEDGRDLAYAQARKGGANRIITEGRKGWPAIFTDLREISRVYEVAL